MDQVKGKGQEQARGQGQGPMGKPKGVNEMDKVKEVNKLVDVILTGDYKEYKTIQDSMTMVDQIIDEVENKIDTVPNQDMDTLYQDVFDELSSDEESDKESPSVEEALSRSVKNLVQEENAYQTFFKSMLQKWNIKSPAELDTEKKKEFFNQVSKEWAAKKGS